MPFKNLKINAKFMKLKNAKIDLFSGTSHAGCV